MFLLQLRAGALEILLIQLASLPPESQNVLPALKPFRQVLEKMDTGKTML